MKTLIVDLECDGFLAACTQVWVLIAQDVHSEKIYTFTDHDERYPGLTEGLAFLETADALAGHNLIGFDLPVLKKLHDWEFKGKVFDTWIISEVTNYNRPHKHGLGGWGGHLNYPKFDFDDFSQYSDDMRRYCQQDVELNRQVYIHLLNDVSDRRQKNAKFGDGLRIEHSTQEFCSALEVRGWNFDMKSANELLQELHTQMEVIENEIEPQLGTVTTLIDKEPKTPKYLKTGEYNANTVRMLTDYFGREVRSTEALLSEPPIEPGTEFQRTKTEPATLGQIETVKQFLYDNGWKPLDWNVKMVNGNWVKQSPKLCEESLAAVGDIGVKISRYYTLRNRKSVLQGWMDHATNDGRLRGKIWARGTPVYRGRHVTVANLPSDKAEYGPDMRNLLIADEGRTLVGADSTNNHIRGLCHYLGDEAFTKQVVEGDMHSITAGIL